MKKLISMTDFVLEQRLKHSESFKSKVYAYANFIKKPLTLGMFVPCDEDGNVLEEPDRWDDYVKAPESFDGNKEWYDLYAYEQAKEMCLFYWSEHIDAVKHHISQGRTIEYLANFGDIELTPYALKQIGL